MTLRLRLRSFIACAASVACANLLACSLDLEALRAKKVGTSAQAIQGVALGAPDAGTRADDTIEWNGEPATGWYPASTHGVAPMHAGSCGDVGQSCCMPGNTCTSGACLRGRCTPYGGLYAEEHGCGAQKCEVRDPYTAGCACPSGFDASSLMHASTSCGADAGIGELEIVACVASGSEASAFGGAWIARASSAACKEECIVRDGERCACPAGAGALRLELEADDGECSGADAALSLCIDPSASALGFGGAFVTTNEAKPQCVVANPVVSDCSCPEAASPQFFSLGDRKLGVCSL